MTFDIEGLFLAGDNTHAVRFIILTQCIIINSLQ
nr:MAG TPA: hypothetical protein [Caudoviricetes sp.]DAS59929.1 MAG TPA: hypothetical protein [Caudoviricetes sp.]